MPQVKDKHILFSVVMCVYINDKLTYIKQAVNSLLEQTFKPSEIIIVVDGFVENDIKTYLVKLGDGLSEVHIVFLKENEGLAAALNTGIRAAKYNIIARMDADDICYLDRFENQIPFFVNAGVDVLGGQMSEFVNHKENVVSERKVPLSHHDIAKRMKYLNPFSHPTTIFKKEVFDKLNGYNTNMFPEDYDFFVRAYLSGFKLANVKENVVYFRLEDAESTMFDRRRGFNFMKKEYRLYKNFKKLGFYSTREFVIFSILKLPVRLLPTGAFKYIYNLVTR